MTETPAEQLLAGIASIQRQAVGAGPEVDALDLGREALALWGAYIAAPPVAQEPDKMTDRYAPVPVPRGDGRHDIGDEMRAAIVRRLTEEWSRDPDLSTEKVRQLAMWASASVRTLMHEVGALKDALTTAAPAPQEPPTIEIGDWVRWDNATIIGSVDGSIAMGIYNRPSSRARLVEVRGTRNGQPVIWRRPTTGDPR